MIARHTMLTALFCLLMQVGADQPRLTWKITPEPDVWKGASVQDVSAVLNSVASVIQRHASPLPPVSVRVSNGPGGPIVYFRRADDGAHRVKLDTGGTYWSQYAFQFAHECAHILCGYRDGHPGNKWFEESLCEMVSLFALRAMAREWEHNPPYPNWKAYRANLDEYARLRIEEHRLPEGTNFPAWISEQLPALSADPTHRDSRAKNTAIAIKLLPFFEQTPDNLRALLTLNEGWDGTAESFPESLDRWQGHAPPDLRPFIESLRTLLLGTP